MAVPEFSTTDLQDVAILDHPINSSVTDRDGTNVNHGLQAYGKNRDNPALYNF
jgi:hypothetical protein